MKKRNISNVLLVAVLGFVLSALVSCATVGHEFAEDKVALIRIGQSTSEDIRRMFGNPWRTGIDDGVTTWTYGLYRYGAFRDAQTSDLVVRFDDKGVVSSYTYNTTEGAQ